MALIVAPFFEVSGQTRFARPDTSPDYASYKHVDECIAAINRLKEFAVAADSVWEDTVRLNTGKFHRPLPDEVVQYAGECLSRLDIDTISFVAIHEYAAALLVANRDADADRLYERHADSIYADSTRGQFMQMFAVYMNAVPVRLEKLRSLYDIGLSSISADSVVRGLMLRAVMGAVAVRSGDHDVAHGIAKEMLEIMDTLPLSLRQSANYTATAKGLFYPFIGNLILPQDAVDSLTVSTQAYRRWLSGIWKTIFAHEPTDEIGPIGVEAPELSGDWWYSNIDGQIKQIEPRSPIENGKVTLVYFLQGGCHSHYVSVPKGRNNGAPSNCWKQIHRVRRIVDQYPNINLVVVSRTFGSVGNAPPLTPDQEADTLAHYFLDFHKLKGLHLIENTDYIRLSEYDDRKVDSETPNQLAYTFGNAKLSGLDAVVMIDEKGEIFHFMGLYGPLEHAAMKRLATIMDREANQGSR